ncbi:hypothetical protein GNY08_07020 [Levilactobacillus brevis]|uniref:hypothetical protein n=1 Tax=Levilactobacillus brevis TaxID=1580 RepID=UPI0018C06136|nr:hypothetical protein [Levilactobacillus brevis]QOX67329.1 hypothetical protein GNY08_07020 [Levilactobacillus brevis]
MRHTEYGYVSPVENHCYHDLERWLADKKKRERRAKKHGAFSLVKEREHNEQQGKTSLDTCRNNH